MRDDLRDFRNEFMSFLDKYELRDANVNEIGVYVLSLHKTLDKLGRDDPDV